MLFERTEDSGIAWIGKQAKRVPEAKGGLQRAGADVQRRASAAINDRGVTGAGPPSSGFRS